MANKNWLFKKGVRNGFLIISDAAKFKGVSVYTIRDNITTFGTCGSITKIRFSHKFVSWNPRKGRKRQFK